MANPQHLVRIKKTLQSGSAQEWNSWRAAKHEIHPEYGYRSMVSVDLSGAELQGLWSFSHLDLADVDFSGADLQGCQFHSANLRRARFANARLDRADLRRAVLDGADLNGAILKQAQLTGASLDSVDLRSVDLQQASLGSANLVRADLRGANLSDSLVYGVSAWDVKVDQETRQYNLRVTPPGEAVVYVDNIEVAGFVYLLLNNKKIRDVVSTLGNKGVLLLGRFSPGRKEVLDALAEALRERGFLPMLFDFERAAEKDFIETIMVLAGLSLFIIADITNPKSAPLELHAAVPDYMIPLVPIIWEKEEPFSMFQNLQAKYDWVLDVIKYDAIEGLTAALDEAIVEPALKMHDQLLVRKSQSLKSKHIKEFLKKKA